MLSNNVTWPKIGIQYLSSSSFVKNSMQKKLTFYFEFIRFLENSFPCAIISSCAIIDFWRFSYPVRLFHAVRLFDTQEYILCIPSYLHPYSRLLTKQHCLGFFLSRVIYVLLHTYWLFAKFPCGLIDFFIHGVCLIDSVVNVYSNEVYILSGPSMKHGRPEAHPSLSQSSFTE